MVKTMIAVKILRLGGRDWHEGEKDYVKGYILDVPDMETAKSFGTSLKVIPEPKAAPTPEPAESIRSDKEAEKTPKTPKKKKRETPRVQPFM